MKLLIPLLILFIFGNSHINKDETRILKSKESYILKVDNKDKQSFGYMHYEDDMDVCIGSIFVDNNMIYFSDLYHKDIKAFDIIKGKLISSDYKFVWVKDFLVHKNKVYVLDYDNYIKVLDSNLVLQKEKYKIGEDSQYFIRRKNKNLILKSNYRQFQDSIIYKAYDFQSIIHKNHKCIKFKDANFPDRVCYYYKEKMIANKRYLNVEGNYYEISYSFENIDYNAYNIFVENDRIVFAFISKEKVQVDVLHY